MESERSQVARGRNISVIVPALNESTRLASCLAQALKAGAEVLVVDGGSRDDTAQIAAAAGAKVLAAERGRASQMNAGAAAANPQSGVLLFLHADTELPEAWAEEIDRAIENGAAWGRFDVHLDSTNRAIRLVGFMMNWRSRLTGIATGDQALFVTRSAWQRCTGYAQIALMEDIELSRRLKRDVGQPACLRARVKVSARRWQQRGVLATILQMWRLRALYFLGASPEYLHRSYYGSSGLKARERK